jgi:hypothetical protein
VGEAGPAQAFEAVWYVAGYVDRTGDLGFRERPVCVEDQPQDGMVEAGVRFGFQ